MKITRKRLIYAAVALVLLVLLGLAFRPKPVPVDFATVERGGLIVTVEEEGETRVRDRFVVSAPLAGRVLRIEHEPGDPVTAGETVLAIFRPNPPVLLDARSRAEAEARIQSARGALGQARADRDRREAELEFARAELARRRKLAADEVISQETLDSSELLVKTREKEVRAAGFAVKSAEQDLVAARSRLIGDHVGDAGGQEPIELRSPIDGVVLRRLHESEAVVPAGEALLEVASPADLEIVSDLLSTDAVKVKLGQRVMIEQWGGEAALEGKVLRVEPSGFTKISALGVEEQRVNVIVDFVDPREAWNALGDGYRVEIRVVVWEREDVLKVPVSSLFRRGSDWAVFLAIDEKAAERKIQIGQRNDLEAEVLEGLEVGDEVLVHPSDDVADGVGLVGR